MPTTAGTHFSVSSNDIIEFRGDNATYSREIAYTYNTFSGSTCRFEARGNIMSLIDSEDYADLDTLSANYTFQRLFDHTPVTDASRLALPATSLSFGCYYNLFHGCILLTRAPKLPATTLVTSCYYEMFEECTSLNHIKCLATTAGGSAPLYLWVRNVAANGTFIKSPDATFWETGNSGIPDGWTVTDAS